MQQRQFVRKTSKITSRICKLQFFNIQILFSRFCCSILWSASYQLYDSTSEKETQGLFIAVRFRTCNRLESVHVIHKNLLIPSRAVHQRRIFLRHRISMRNMLDSDANILIFLLLISKESERFRVRVISAARKHFIWREFESATVLTNVHSLASSTGQPCFLM